MSHHFGSQWIKKTRKPHQCCWCGRRIEAGSVAEYGSGICDGEFWSGHMHPECAAARDSLPYVDLQDGWLPGDFARGRTDDDHDQPPTFSTDYRGRQDQPL